MIEFLRNLIDSKNAIFLSVATILLSGVLKYYISMYSRKKDGAINIKLKKGNVDIEIKNINPKDVNVDEVIKKLQEKMDNDRSVEPKSQ